LFACEIRNQIDAPHLKAKTYFAANTFSFAEVRAKMTAMKPQFICALILSSKTPAKLAKFYKDVLGLPMVKRDATQYTSHTGVTHFAIHKTPKGKQPTRRTEIGFQIPNLDGFVKKLTTKKIKLVSPIQSYPWARSAQINDPEGNIIYLMELPESSLKQLRKFST
jgi:predicted enzyme related to lactoylglutathione lyase